MSAQHSSLTDSLLDLAASVERSESTLDHVFREEPVDLHTFVTDRGFMGSEPLGDIQFDAVKHLERVLYPDVYPQMAAEFGPYWGPLRSVNFGTLQWGKGCLVGDEPIYDAATGSWVPISEWKGGLVAGMREDGSVGRFEASAAFVRGRGECFEVRTRLGRKMRVYGGHQFLAKYDWEPLWHLGQGDKIRAVEYVPDPDRPSVDFDDLSACLEAAGPWDEIVSVESIGTHDYWDLKVAEVHNYVAGGGLVNHNSGKDYVCRVVSMRVAYILACLHNPLTYFGLPDTDSIHLLNVASSAPQAQRAFFKPLTKIVTRPGSWFLGKCSPTQSSIVWSNNVEQVSGHSDADLQEGLNILLGVADEIDAFPTEEEARRSRGAAARLPTNSAEAILEMLRTSAASRFPETFKVVRISYPRYKGSTIQLLTEDARKENEEMGEKSRHYVSGPYSTWEVNPRHAKTGKKAFAEDYRKDAAMARAKYECKPEYSSDPFFRNLAAWELCERECGAIGIDYWWNGSKQSWEVDFDFPPDLVPIQGAQYAMHGDIALTGDRAGVAMAHIKKWDEFSRNLTREDLFVETVSHTLPVLQVDFACYFHADVSAQPFSREVQIRWYRELMRELQYRGFNIRRYTFDGFQSADIIQQLEYAGVESTRVSMDTNDLHWKNFRDLVYSNRVSIPRGELLKKEIFQLTRAPNGKLDHVPGGSKDVADAVCGALVGAIELGGAEDPEGARNWFGGHQEHYKMEVPDTLPVEMPFDREFSFGGDLLGMGAGAWK